MMLIIPPGLLNRKRGQVQDSFSVARKIPMKTGSLLRFLTSYDVLWHRSHIEPFVGPSAPKVTGQTCLV